MVRKYIIRYRFNGSPVKESRKYDSLDDIRPAYYAMTRKPNIMYAAICAVSTENGTTTVTTVNKWTAR